MLQLMCSHFRDEKESKDSRIFQQNKLKNIQTEKYCLDDDCVTSTNVIKISQNYTNVTNVCLQLVVSCFRIIKLN